ncbi:hypothetical protein M405DRAFT_860011 [Rhizopogon salebrosus TDB-379]|nr:hypothetical protein M405DRAFT_860011 [Rhizopogon salebrosus TDB-379]
MAALRPGAVATTSTVGPAATVTSEIWSARTAHQEGAHKRSPRLIRNGLNFQAPCSLKSAGHAVAISATLARQARPDVQAATIATVNGVDGLRQAFHAKHARPPCARIAYGTGMIADGA